MSNNYVNHSRLLPITSSTGYLLYTPRERRWLMPFNSILCRVPWHLQTALVFAFILSMRHQKVIWRGYYQRIISDKASQREQKSSDINHLWHCKQNIPVMVDKKWSGVVPKSLDCSCAYDYHYLSSCTIAKKKYGIFPKFPTSLPFHLKPTVFMMLTSSSLGVPEVVTTSGASNDGKLASWQLSVFNVVILHTQVNHDINLMHDGYIIFL